MAREDRWLRWAVELQSVAQSALHYCRDEYDIERFRRIREIAAEMVSCQAELPMETVMDVFCCESGYQTPKIDVRAAIFEGDKVLLVRERDGLWSLPGGWCDVDLSVRESVVKEVKEEAGLDVVADRIIALQDRDKHNVPIYAHKICKIFVHCMAIGGSFSENIETTESRYFALADLPPLNEAKNTARQIGMCFDAHWSDHWQALFD